MIDICAEKGLSVSKTYFDLMNLHRYTRVDRRQDVMEVMSMIDLVLVKKVMLRYVEDV